MRSPSPCFFTRNSSIDGNEYVDEELSDGASRFAPALLHSNRIIEHIASSNIDKLFALGSREFVRQNNRDTVANLVSSIDENFGGLLEYKSQQWSFTTFKHEGISYVYSSKIVIHEKAETIYHILYVDDDLFTGYQALFIRTRVEGESMSAATKRVINDNT